MTSPSSMSRTYSSGVGGRIGAIVTGTLVVILFSYGIPQFLLRSVLGVRELRVLFGAGFAVLVIGIIWVLVHTFLTGPIRFQTDDRTVRLRRGIRSSNEWKRDSTVFSSFVERQYTNGIPSGTTRKVFASTPSERTEIVARWFTAATFTALMADLAPIAPRTLETPVTSSRTFALDPRASGLQGTRRSVVTILAIGALATLGIVAFFVFTDETADPEALIFIGGAVLFTALVVIIAAVSGRVRRSRIPASISLTGATLSVGDEVMALSQLTTVEVTPPTYSGARQLTLIDTSGTRRTYRLGTGSDTGVPVFAEYDEFVEMLSRATPPGVLRFNLQ